jgi:hypothetical protein
MAMPRLIFGMGPSRFRLSGPLPERPDLGRQRGHTVRPARSLGLTSFI